MKLPERQKEAKEPRLEEVCLLIFNPADKNRPLVAPNGVLPARETGGKHPAEVVWELACAVTGRTDYSSFHRFAVSLDEDAGRWVRTCFYTTAPDEDEKPLDAALWAGLDTVLAHTPARHTRILRESEFARDALR